MQHFDTYEDAMDNSERIFYGAEPEEIILFEYSIAVKSVGIEQIEEESKAISLGAAQAKMIDRYRNGGLRPRFSSGKIDIDFGGGSRLVLERRTQSRGQAPITVWRATNFSSLNQYKTLDFPLLSTYRNGQRVLPLERSGYSSMEAYISRSFTEALDRRLENLAKRTNRSNVENADPDYEKSLREAYENSIQVIDQIEIMSNGAADAYRDYGIDLFSHSDANTMDLTLDLDRSTVDTRDIVESLGVHATEDDRIKRVQITIGDKVEETESSWLVTRSPDGSWHYSETRNGTTSSEPIDLSKPAEYSKKIEDFYPTAGGGAWQRPLDKSQLAHRLLVDIEPAIRNYEHTVTARTEHKDTRKNQVQTTATVPPATNKKSLKNRLYSLYK
jgi:hypothetical protein